ncbi:hypothetical protein [Arthrobacter sp. B3I4]|uniref:hypothetical protein n=1 Tax=Arthrobacter sp. B3I4 TaxID=3042267 RepID=UPI00277FDC0B|nr:hypothetical protein [Arthrobacter sp. B3I4]MDQ0756617.1 hypothetical protein [Arthrobacter sp. B3I4]
MDQMGKALRNPAWGRRPAGPRPRLTTLAGTVIAGVLGLLAAASPAQADPGESLQVRGGKLLGSGAEVQVRVSYQCQVGAQAGVGVFLTQDGHHAAVYGGAGSGQRPCTGETQKLTMTIPAGSGRFHPGCASVTVSLFTRGPGTPDSIEQLVDDIRLDHR